MQLHLVQLLHLLYTPTKKKKMTVLFACKEEKLSLDESNARDVRRAEYDNEQRLYRRYRRHVTIFIGALYVMAVMHVIFKVI
jgi:hypothetical protein